MSNKDITYETLKGYYDAAMEACPELRKTMTILVHPDNYEATYKFLKENNLLALDSEK